MRSFDFAPLHRATVGFDQIADLMDRVLTADNKPSYPPYNIEKLDKDSYRISIAVAGFSDADLSVEVKEKSLVVSGRKADEQDGERTFLHRGIATRAFERRFHLADHIRVMGATHENGMLHIELQREVPEALKPRRIDILKSDATEADVVEGKALN